MKKEKKVVFELMILLFVAILIISMSIGWWKITGETIKTAIAKVKITGEVKVLEVIVVDNSIHCFS